MEQLLALFPLNVVLFPGAILPLHIFEPRYRQMISRCIQLKQPFGVVLIREGEEVGGPVAEPYTVGTTAAIQNVLRFPDGRMLLSAQGERRFRILQIIQDDPYLVASVEMLEDEIPPDAPELAAQVRELYLKHRDAVTHATGVTQPLEELPDDPVALSYLLSDQFRVVNYSKQQLLEADVEERLGAIAEAFDRELRFLPQPPQMPARTSDGPWTLN
ncbi:MAG TPA: LON peptidase substrate-binding domain-containing protein [Herpetosiphonaceae bacterium]